MSAIALLLPRLRRAQPSAAPFRTVSPPARETQAAVAKGIDWEHLAPALESLGPVLHVDGVPAIDDPTQVAPSSTSAPWPACVELLGLVRARRVVASVLVDSHGPREALHFLGTGNCRHASIWLLPDSDFLAWERLLERLPDAPAADVAWWQELPHHVSRGCARVRRFTCGRLAGRVLVDIAPASRLSRIGLERARQIAAMAGARLVDAPM